MTQSDISCDVGIIGGGPAGAAMAAYLAKAGVSCIVFEKALFPRPHVGESLVPSSMRVFRDLDFIQTMEDANFPRKFGAAWTSGDQAPAYSHDWDQLHALEEVDIRFEERKQPGVDRDYTYHVDRSKFDTLLLQHANKLGAEVHEGVNVLGVDFSSEHPTVRYAMGKKEMGCKVRMVVDASGRNTVLGNQLRLKTNDPVFNQYAFHTWFDNFDRKSLSREGEKFGDYIFVHFLPVSNSWIWQIPITETITSIGVVTQKHNFAKAKGNREAWFWEMVGNRPQIAEQLRKARQVTPFKEEGDYSYAMKDIVGDKFCMIGDAARFVDPIFSTGVSIALNSARFAQKDIIRGLEKNDLSKASFSEYETTIRRGTKNWYDFITVYYRLNVLFTWFIRNPTYRLDVLKLLQGDVYDEEQPLVLQKMREKVAEVEANPEHPWHKLLGDLTSNAFRPCG
jgi:FADH2 O2-dependent halogenase